MAAPNPKRPRDTATADPSSSTPLPLSTEQQSNTTISTLLEDLIVEILLRVTSGLSIARASLTCPQWRRLARSGHFVQRFTGIHPAGPLLGLFSDGIGVPRPLFRPSASARADPDRAAVIRHGDFFLTAIPELDDWRVHDCYRGFLLLAIRESLIMAYNPVSHLRICVNSPPPLLPSEGRWPIYLLCLIPWAEGRVPIRIAGVQRRPNKIRTVVYDHDNRKWDPVPWTKTSNPLPMTKDSADEFTAPMHGGSFIYWKYRRGDIMLCLDTSTMGLRFVGLQPVVSSWSMFVVGEKANGLCCLIYFCLSQEGSQYTLQTWCPTHGDDGRVIWDLENKDVTRVITGFVPTALFAMARGMAVVRVASSTPSRSLPYMAIRIDDDRMEVEASFRMHGPRPFPYIMEWPPAALSSRVEVHPQNRMP